MRILLAVPTYETIASETFKSIYDLDRGGHDVTFESVKGYDCARARNIIASMTLEGEYTHALMVDSDMVLPPDALVNLLEYPADLVLGCYPHKNTKDHEVEIFKLDQKDYKKRFRYQDLGNEPRIKVKGGGFGCALVAASSLRKIEYPYFKYVTYASGTTLSEDLYFCSELRRAGGKIEADTRVRCGHIMKRTVYD